MQKLQTFDKKLVIHGGDSQIHAIVEKLLDDGFPKIATRLSYWHGSLETSENKLQSRSVARFYEFLTACKSKALSASNKCEIDVSPDGFVNATWFVGTSIIMITFHGSGTVRFSILTDDRTKTGLAPRLSGTIQNVVMTKSLDSLIDSTAHVENHD